MKKAEYMKKHGLSLRPVQPEDLFFADTDDKRRSEYIISDGENEWFSVHGSMKDLMDFVKYNRRYSA